MTMEGKVVSINRNGESLLFLVLHQDGDDYWLEQLFTEAAVLAGNQVVVVDGYYPSQGYILGPAQALTEIVRELNPQIFLAHKALSQSSLDKLVQMKKYSKR